MHQPNRILLIKDDPAVAQSLQVGLEREGYSVTWKDTGTQVTDGSEVWTRLES